MTVAEDMIYADLGAAEWRLRWAGVFIGLIAWVIIAAVAGWLKGQFFRPTGPEHRV